MLQQQEGNLLPSAVRPGPLVLLFPRAAYKLKRLSPRQDALGTSHSTEGFCADSQALLTETTGFSVNLWIIYIDMSDACDDQYKIKESRVLLRSWGALEFDSVTTVWVSNTEH